MTANQIVDFLLEAVVENPKAVKELMAAALRIRHQGSVDSANYNPVMALTSKETSSLIDQINADPVWLKHGITISRKSDPFAVGAYSPGKKSAPGKLTLIANSPPIKDFLDDGYTTGIERVIAHELVHKEQHRHSDWAPKLRAIHKPSTPAKTRKYYNPPWEIMAHVKDYITRQSDREQAMRNIGRGMLGFELMNELSPTNKKRAMRYAVQYAKKLPAQAEQNRWLW